MDGSFVFLALASLVMNVSVVTGLRPLVMPRTADYFEVASITADRKGDTAELHVIRTIHAPVVMEYTVRIMQDRPEGLVQVCSARGGPFEYQPRAIMPEPVSLEWWTDGQCVTLPPGPAQIVTTWTPADQSLKPLTVRTSVE